VDDSKTNPGKTNTAGQKVPPGGVRACWNDIGVYGASSCAELEKFVHCRNCPVYSTAGVELLDRPLPENYRREWSQHFSAEKHRATPAKISVLIFRIAAEWLALPTTAFQEVAERRLTHSLPHRRQGIVAGLINVRGELLICVSLRRLLGLDRGSMAPVHQPSDRLLVMNWDGNRLAFAVDEIYGVYRFQPSELRDAPATVSKSNVTFTKGVFIWQQNPVGLLEADALFSTLNRSLA
jgi:chemotaxis-related protein WspD